MTTRVRRRRALAAGLVGGLLLALGAGTAAAAPVIAPGTLGSLTVHKYEQPDVPTGLPNDGSELTDPIPGAEPLNGAQFTLYRVTGIDLTTNAGWVAAEALERTFDPATVRSGDGATVVGDYPIVQQGDPVTTAGEGTAVFANLPIALYLVVETGTPAGFSPAASFMVTVPLTQTDPGTQEQGWDYDVHVYPKNPAFTASKTVTDAVDQDPATEGYQIRYEILGDIPAQGMDRYVVIDTLHESLTYAPDATHSDIIVSVTGGAASVPLDFGVHYAVDLPTPGAGVTTQDVAIDVNTAGLAVIRAAGDASASARVSVSILVTVDSIAEITNVAQVFPSQAAVNGAPTLTPGVESKWGDVTIVKSSSTGTSALGGAEFELFYTTGPSWDGTTVVAPGGPATATAAVQLTIDGETVFPTAGNGRVTLGPLRYSDLSDGGAVTPGDPGYRHYWLREVTPLAGHELLAAPVGFTVIDASTSTSVPTRVEMPIVNVASNAGFTLPFTGGVGTVWFSVAGVLLLAGATLVLARQRSRRRRVSFA
ncbi:hypothetical protein GCM10025875_32960 [Litorihabitans aurantiacus]|uniref:Isopeptide-forming domain-containing fimbrial protein n=2 Tax=Litorihabitans aurantiacus TaxID=1930061 RepID=A0AA37XHY4_9MICO|nr:hypothetical protein GCM10025875_32960 [Litorihabitans aurantiacus]